MRSEVVLVTSQFVEDSSSQLIIPAHAKWSPTGYSIYSTMHELVLADSFFSLSFCSTVGSSRRGETTFAYLSLEVCCLMQSTTQCTDQSVLEHRHPPGTPHQGMTSCSHCNCRSHNNTGYYHLLCESVRNGAPYNNIRA